jgi:RNA polymerase sigma-70 factor (ECF subfamily)
MDEYRTMVDITILVEKWRRGDGRAAENIFNYYKTSTYRLAYSLLNDANDAEEVTQDALTYALNNIQRFDANKASFSTWLHLITVSRCRDKRRRKFLPSISLSKWFGLGFDLPDTQPNPEQAAIQAETHGQVLAAVQALNPRLREAIILRYWANHTYKEMAEILHCPLSTAQARVRLAYKQLRQQLTPLLASGEAFEKEGTP